MAAIGSTGERRGGPARLEPLSAVLEGITKYDTASETIQWHGMMFTSHRSDPFRALSL